MPPDQAETWLSKLRWRLDHGLSGPAMRAMAELSPAMDPVVIQTLIEALSFRDQGVREAATAVLDISGWRYAQGEVWTEAAAALRTASESAFDEEERRNMARAAGNIEARLRNPPPAASESAVERLDWYLFQGIGFEGDAVRAMTEISPTDDADAIALMTDCLRRPHAPKVLKHAVKCLTACGERHARNGPMWEGVLQALRDIYDSPYDTAEDRESRARAIETLETRIAGD